MNQGLSQITPNAIPTSPSLPPPSSHQNRDIKTLVLVFAAPVFAVILIVFELCIAFGALSPWFLFAIPALYGASICGDQKYTAYVLRSLVFWHMLVLPLLQLLTLGPLAVVNGPAIYLFWFLPHMFVSETKLSPMLYRIYDWIRIFIGSFTIWFMVLFFQHIPSVGFNVCTMFTLILCTFGLGTSSGGPGRPKLAILLYFVCGYMGTLLVVPILMDVGAVSEQHVFIGVFIPTAGFTLYGGTKTLVPLFVGQRMTNAVGAGAVLVTIALEMLLGFNVLSPACVVIVLFFYIAVLFNDPCKIFNKFIVFWHLLVLPCLQLSGVFYLQGSPLQFLWFLPCLLIDANVFMAVLRVLIVFALPLASTLSISDERFSTFWWILQLILVHLSMVFHDDSGLQTTFRILHFVVLFVWNCVVMPILVMIGALPYHPSLLCVLILTLILPTAWRLMLSSPNWKPVRITLCLLSLPLSYLFPILTLLFGLLQPGGLSYTYSYYAFLLAPCFVASKLANALRFDVPQHHQTPALLTYSVSSVMFLFLVVPQLPNALASDAPSNFLIFVSIVMFLYSLAFLDVFRQKSSQIQEPPLYISELSEWDKRPRIFAKIRAQHNQGKRTVVTHRLERDIEYFDCIDKTFIPATPVRTRYHLSPVVVLEVTQDLQKHLSEQLKTLYEENKHLDQQVFVTLCSSAHEMVQDVYVGCDPFTLKCMKIMEKISLLTMMLVPFYMIRAIIFPVVSLEIRKKLTKDSEDLKSVSHPLIYAFSHDVPEARLPPWREIGDFEKFSGYDIDVSVDAKTLMLPNLKKMRTWHKARRYRLQDSTFASVMGNPSSVNVEMEPLQKSNCEVKLFIEDEDDKSFEDDHDEAQDKVDDLV